MNLKSKLILASILLFSLQVSVAKKLDLVCDAAIFNIESDMDAEIKPGYIRTVSPAISAFVASDGYSTTTTIECKKDDETGLKQCLGLNNNNYCKNPKDIFRVRSTKEDNSIIMVGNRCMGSYKKYVLTTESIEDIVDPLRTGKRLTYYEDRMLFKMKNQIFSPTGAKIGTSYGGAIIYRTINVVNAQPVLNLDLSGEGFYYLEITSSELENPKDKYSLETTCRNKR